MVQEKEALMRKSHGDGSFRPSQFAKLGKNVIFEKGVLVFHPENIEIADDVYIGHYSILKGYYRNKMVIGSGTWIGQQCFLHASGGITVGENVGIGPAVKILTSTHSLDEEDKPILHSAMNFAPVTLGKGCDIGTGSIILPGVSIGQGSQIGAGAVVTSSIEDFAVAAGNPAKIIRSRK